MSLPELPDPLKRHGSRFLERRERITKLYSAGQEEEALRLTRQKHARVIWFVFQQKPDIKTQEAANVLEVKWPTAKTFINRLTEVGIPLKREENG